MAKRSFPAKKHKFNKTGNMSTLRYNAVWRCDGCGVTYPAKRKADKPSQCMNKSCGSLEFSHFHSTAEVNRWAFLLILKEKGIITNLKRQVRIPLHVPVELNGRLVKKKVYEIRPDFTYDKDGKNVVEDTKGQITKEWDLKRKHFEAEYGEEIILTK